MSKTLLTFVARELAKAVLTGIGLSIGKEIYAAVRRSAVQRAGAPREPPSLDDDGGS